MPQYFDIASPTYLPVMRIVVGITNASSPTVTTSIDHEYLSGEIVRLIVPFNWGMTQMNGKVGEITVLSPTTFSIDINSTDFDTFVVPTPNDQYPFPAQVIPIGERNDMITAATRNILT